MKKVLLIVLFVTAPIWSAVEAAKSSGGAAKSVAEVVAVVAVATLVINAVELGIESVVSEEQWAAIKKLHGAFLCLPFDWEKCTEAIKQEWLKGNYRLVIQAGYEVGVSAAVIGIMLAYCGICWGKDKISKIFSCFKRKKVKDVVEVELNTFREVPPERGPVVRGREIEVIEGTSTLAEVPPSQSSTSEEKRFGTDKNWVTE